MSFIKRHMTLHATKCVVAVALMGSLMTSKTGFGQQSPDDDASTLYTATDVEDVLNTPGTSAKAVSLTTDQPVSFSQHGCSDLFEGQQLQGGQQCCHRNHVLPKGLLYRSYIAGPHEPRMGTVAHYDLSDKSWRWDSTLGGRVGLFRRDQPPRMNLDAWQIDLEGAVMVRLDPSQKMDLESSDYRLGLLWTGRQDRISYKAGYFHVSSHVGDEYLIKNPGFQRVNYVRENLIFGTSYNATQEWRFYGEVAYAIAISGGAEPWQIQFGAEYARQACRPERGAPFAALNFQMRQEVNFAAGVTAMTGWQWTGPESGHTIRTGVQYFNGPSNQYEFYQRFDNQLGVGIWFDY